MNNMTLAPPTPIDAEAIRHRQSLLVAQMQQRGCGLTILTRSESVYWLTGAWVGPLWHPVVSLSDDGKVTLVLPSRKVETPAVADAIFPYEEKRLSTMRDASEQANAALGVLFDQIASAPDRAACEFTAAPRQLMAALSGDWVDFDPVLFRLRRKKHADELALMRWANRANRAMYERARELIEPGLNELDLYNELHATAVRTLGEPLTYFGQDFQVASRGGPPRDREAQSGELWILDLGVGYRGYYTDNARTLAVDQPDANQQQAWEAVAEVFEIVENSVTPGVSCSVLFEQVAEHLASSAPWVFNHHLGHGVGLAPHEAPRLNPNWDDTFAVGDFFTVEPGLYHDDLRQGVRLEQNYVVTESGVELQTDWPLEL